MTKKSIYVEQVKALEDGQNGEKRYSLRESGEHFCVLVQKDGDDTIDTIEKVRTLYQGKEVIAITRKFTNEAGEERENWFFLNAQNVDAYVQREANRDIDAKINVAKAITLAKVTKETRAAGVDLSAITA
jgi:hypothetical protein